MGWGAAGLVREVLFADKERERVDCPHHSRDSGGCH